jgi:ABC-type Na+ efflux pump permease subunit
MKFLDKIRNKPKRTRKIILFSVVIVLGLLLVSLWIFNIRRVINNFDKEGFIEKLNVPDFDEQMKGFQNIEIPDNLKLPDMSEEDFKKFEEEIKRLEEEDAKKQSEDQETSGPQNETTE